jgi:phage FluMu protein Com
MERLLCQKCGKFLRAEAYGSVVARFICPNSKCKHVNNIRKIVLDSTHNLTVKFPDIKA